MIDCGGCQGIGSHKKHCRHNPLYSRAWELADALERVADDIGPNDMDAANATWRAAGILRRNHPKGQPW